MNIRIVLLWGLVMNFSVSIVAMCATQKAPVQEKQSFLGDFGSMVRAETEKIAKAIKAAGILLASFIKNFPTIVKEHIMAVNYFDDKQLALTISKDELFRDNQEAKTIKAFDALLPFGLVFTFDFAGAGEGDTDFPLNKGFLKPAIMYSPAKILGLIDVKAAVDGLLGVGMMPGEDKSVFNQITQIVGPDLQGVLMRLRDVIFIPREELAYVLKNIMLLTTITSAVLSKKTDQAKVFSDFVREELFMLARLSYTIDSAATKQARAKDPHAPAVYIDPLTPLRRFDAVLPGVIKPIVDSLGKIPMPVAKNLYEWYIYRYKAQKEEASDVERSVAKILTTNGWIARVTLAKKILVPLIEKADVVDRRYIIQLLFSFVQSINVGLWGASEVERAPEEQTKYDIATVAKRQEEYKALLDIIRPEMEKASYDRVYMDALDSIATYVDMSAEDLYDETTFKNPFARQETVKMPLCKLDGESVIDMLWGLLRYEILHAKMPGHPEYFDVAISLSDIEVIKRLVALVLFVIQELPSARAALIKEKKDHESVKAYLKAANLYEEKRKRAANSLDSKDKRVALDAYKDVKKILKNLDKAAFSHTYEMFKKTGEQTSLFSLVVKDLFLVMQKASGLASIVKSLVNSVLSGFESLVGVKPQSFVDRVQKETDMQEELQSEKFVEDLPEIDELVAGDAS